MMSTSMALTIEARYGSHFKKELYNTVEVIEHTIEEYDYRLRFELMQL